MVVGGNGFVGNAVVQTALQKGLRVFSVSRSGHPTWNAPWMSQVNWLRGDILQPPSNEIKEAFKEAQGVVSVVGAFGKNDFMEKVCGDTNISAVQQAKEAGVPRFVFVSVHDFKHLPESLLRGYFHGKRRAEEEVKRLYKEQGTILRPGMIYGTRHVSDKVALPLWLIGAPLAALTDNSIAQSLNRLPFVGPLLEAPLVPPVPVKSIGRAAVDAIASETSLPRDGQPRILTVNDIRRFN